MEVFNECCVEGCNSSESNNENVTLYKLPTKSDIKEKWMNVFASLNQQTTITSFKICSKHFPTCCFFKKRGKSRIRRDVLPSIFPKQKQKRKDLKNENNEDIQHPPAIPINTTETIVKEELDIDSYEDTSISYDETSYGYPDCFESKMETTNADHWTTINQDTNLNLDENVLITHTNDANTEDIIYDINDDNSITLNRTPEHAIPLETVGADDVLIEPIMQPDNFEEPPMQQFVINTTNGKTDNSDCVTYLVRLADSPTSSNKIQKPINFPSTSNPNVLVPIISKRPTKLTAPNTIQRKVIYTKRNCMPDGEDKYPTLVKFAARMLESSRDDNGIFGTFVSHQLRRITSNITRNRTKRLIQNILLDGIEEDTIQTNSRPAD